MSAPKRPDMLFQPELQLQLAAPQAASRQQTPDASALCFDAAHYDRWADELRAAPVIDASTTQLRKHWSSHRTAQLNTIALHRAGAKMTH